MGRPTIRDLSVAAGVSVATVNRVLAGSGKVGPATMQRVLEAAQSVGFYGLGAVQQRVASAQPQHRLGVIVQTPHRLFSQAIEKNLETVAEEFSQAGDGEALLRFEHLDDLSPESVAARMLAVGETVDAIGVVAAEHPIVTDAIDRLAARGVPVIALVSPLSARAHVGFVGLDGWKVGRMAAWVFGHLCKAAPGKLGILVGTHRYRCHDQNESGFRSYFREHANERITLLEPQSTFESDAIAREVTEKLLRSHADLAGLYVSGGGIGGALAALRDSGRSGQVVTVGYDLLDSTRAGLLDGSLTVVISHPFRRFAHETVVALVQAKASKAGKSGSAAGGLSVIVPFEIYTRENI